MQPRLETLREGEIIDGEVTALHLLHGCVVDIGNEFHGIAYANELQWLELKKHLRLFQDVKVRVHRVRFRGGPSKACKRRR